MLLSLIVNLYNVISLLKHLFDFLLQNDFHRTDDLQGYSASSLYWNLASAKLTIPSFDRLFLCHDNYRFSVPNPEPPKNFPYGKVLPVAIATSSCAREEA